MFFSCSILSIVVRSCTILLHPAQGTCHPPVQHIQAKYITHLGVCTHTHTCITYLRISCWMPWASDQLSWYGPCFT